MCGVTGIITADGRIPDADRLRAMNDRQSHRGPDDHARIVVPGAGLGHRRLTILDPTSGAQPMTSADGRYTLVYNGEIYNYRTLNRTLEAAGYQFSGHCDTDTLLAAWQHWGPDCVQHLRGMFAFAVWDAVTGRLFAARDRLGIKPLYYAVTPAGDLLFASELKSLRAHPDLDRRLDPRAIESYLALGYVPEPLSIYTDARKLAAGHTLTWRAGMRAPTTVCYWDVDFSAVEADADMGTAAQDLRARLDEAVRMRLVADVPLGAFLSGGLDSSAIVSLMAGATADPVNTCAIGFKEAAYDESAHARRVAETFGTAHRAHQISAHDFDLIDRLIDVYDEPFADASALPTYRVCELARRQVTVALSGDGGDEDFAGYRRYRLHANESRVRDRVPLALRRPVFGTLGRLYPKLDRAPRFLRARTTFQSLARDTATAYCHSVSIMPVELREALYSPAFTQQLDGYRVESLFAQTAENAATDDPLSIAQYLDYKTWLPGDILTKVDRASMAHGLEVRVPLLDHDFVNWAARLPSDFKLRGGQGKYVFKQAFADVLDTNVRDRRKQGFSVPLADWFRGPLRQTGEHALTQGPLVTSGLFEPEALARLWQRHTSGAADHGASLWSLLMLSNFLAREAGETDWGTPVASAS
ncbi:XrtA/PEP-CTERM system amidotransferase [Salinisphaera sp. Q1T1-3]|uniref:XrtA/PEP-CTERM system amidotransferase n=1 Tax=Salinisphaera sp. Q1T1-3 TaxID=2321229 RepID=UPI000E76A6D5|nr:XrtA/PEP-CTERM system amidotransferase [Salinisphaera sp. Q1T1-3]RJS94724.1 amidotransferase 1, exosortase A system-associated [Salinisphaera sp. Q1T1-3]